MRFQYPRILLLILPLLFLLGDIYFQFAEMPLDKLLPRWLIVFGLEGLWLVALWLFLPDRQLEPSTDPPEPVSADPAVSPMWTGLLFVYTVYHLPGVAFALISGCVDTKRVRPAGFLFLGLTTGLVYVSSFGFRRA